MNNYLILFFISMSMVLKSNLLENKYLEINIVIYRKVVYLHSF